MTRLLLAVEIASFILMGFVIGSFIDSRQGTRPWGHDNWFFGWPIARGDERASRN